MRSMSVVGAMSLLVVQSACSTKKETSASPSGTPLTISVSVTSVAASASPPKNLPTGELTATMEGKTYKFPAAYIKNAGQHNTIVLTTVTGGCDAELTDKDIELDFQIDAGPGGKYYAPNPVSGYVDIEQTKSTFKVSGRGLYEAEATLERGDFKPGDKVKGTLKFGPDKDDEGGGKVYTYQGGGAFEATVCNITSDLLFPPVADTVDSQPVNGSVGSAKVTTKSAIAVLEHDSDRDTDFVNEIDLFSGVVDCKSYSAAKGKDMYVTISGRNGSSGTQKLIGTPQPRLVYAYPDGKKQIQIWGAAWVKFDQLDLTEGGTIKGSMDAESAAYDAKDHPERAGKLAGTFTATVCK